MSGRSLRPSRRARQARAAAERPKGVAKRIRRSPPAVLSLISHSILLWILLVWLVFPGLFEKVDDRPKMPIQIHIAEISGNTDDEQADEMDDPAEESAAESAEDVPVVDNERAREVEEEKTEEQTIGFGNQGAQDTPEQPEVQEDLDEKAVLDALEQVSRMSTREAPAFSTRNADGRRDGVGKYGGSELTESAVELGLAWLAAHQSADGRWDSNHFNRMCPSRDKCGGSGLMSYDPAQTGLALLAFLGAGYLPDEGSYGREVAAGIDFLLQEQSGEGLFGNGDLYNHSISLFALAEAYGMTRERRLRQAVQKGVRLLVDAQQPSGGWSYTRNPRAERNDSSISAFAIMALKAALVAGIHVPDKAFAGAIGHFRRMTDADTATVTYADRGPQFNRTGMGLVAVGLFCRLLLGQPTDDPVIHRAIARLSSNPPQYNRRQSLDNSMYYWYYGSLAMFHIGGIPWDNWNRSMIRCIVGSQQKAGHAAGSWEPDSKWGPNGGRIYSTAVNVLSLEVYYKYAPGYLQQMPDLERFWFAPVDDAGPGMGSGR